MEQSPPETNRFSAGQEFPCFFMEPEVSSVYSLVPATGPYPEPDRSSPVPPTPHFMKLYLNIILPSTPVSPMWSF